MSRYGSTSSPERSGNRDIRPLGALLPYLARYKGRVLLALLALVGAAVTTLVLPVAIRRMIDFGFGADDPALINSYFTVLIAVVACLAGFSALRYFLVTSLGERIVADIRADVFAHLVHLSPAYFDSAKSGEMVSRLTADATQVKSAVGASASIAMRNLVMFLGASAMMVVTSPRLSLFVLAAIPVIVLPLIAFGRSVRRRSRKAQDTLADASAYASEAIGAVRTLQAFTNEKLAGNRFAASVEEAFRAARTAILARALLTAFAIFVIASSVVTVLWVGASDVFTGRISAGELGQFLLYSIFAAGALGELSQVWGEISLAAGAAERLAELLRIEPEISAPENPVALPARISGSVRFDKVSFSYAKGSDVPVVNGIDLDIAPGETVAVVGPSGAGKSTLFHLLMRFYDPSEGAILIDGMDLRTCDPRDIRGHMALVPQDTVVFGTTVLENIAFGRPDATPEEIRRAAELALADEFIRALPQGYDTEIGERGVTLSGGQRQRIAIARAILKDAPLLLLDEATSALDAESETVVQQALERLMEQRTTLVIAHRLATILKSDRIIVMDGGKIVETGTHSDLVARGGLYAKLAKLQFETGAQAFSAASEASAPLAESAAGE
ncbi:ATP-binding cassette domain-containing protein [Stappia taiwanensis]|uniref:ATP-binding cassette domain-containing protein n=1 Tax=Stappia taiwanensis TaxID=992267 RepID=A0A838XZ74_9HYPH|nr:ABC transporter transmembrane domain-containing protein [Stappia taiwanensis]MBA4612314.1 ATP-binding cassette domain-containing protein [Stappia taiwanensis]GGF04439.1 ABC transporter [Stappia taiwanensis]